MNKRTEQTRWTPKRLLSLLMALIMTLSLLPTAALAAASSDDKYTLVVDDAPGQLITGQESADITATLSSTDATLENVRLKVTVTPATGAEIKRYDTATSTYVTTTDYLDNGTTHPSVSSSSSVSANFKLSFNAAGSYTVEVTAVSVDTTTGTETGSLVSEPKTIEVKDAIDKLTVDPANPEAGQPFTVRAVTNVAGNIDFSYGTQHGTVFASPRADGTYYANIQFTADNTVSGANVISAILFDTTGTLGTKTATVNVGTPAMYHTVTFHENAAGVYNMPPSQTVENGQAAVESITPQRDGYTFGGWYKDAACTTPFAPTTPVTEDLHLYAGWNKIKYPVIFAHHPTDVTPFLTTPTTPNSAAVGDTVTFNITVPAKYDTTNMLVSVGNPGVYMLLAPASQHTSPTNGSTTFYYHFEVKDQMIDRDTDPAAPKIPIVVDSLTAKTFTVMMPTGHFDAEITGATPAPPATGTVSTVADNKKSASIVYGGSYTFTVTPDEGYDVAVYVNGVKKDAGADGKYTVTDVTGPQSVAVVESAIPNYNVIFTVPLSGQSFMQSVARGKTATNPGVDPEREGYTFAGWYAKDEYNKDTGATPFNFDTPITKDTILYGKLTPNTYTITYHLNGASGTAPADQPKTHGLAEKLSETVPTREGYTFLGWGTTASATAASYQPGDMYSVDKEITLYAVWQQKTYTITFSSGEGYSLHNGHASMTVAHGANFDFNLIVDRAYAENEPKVWKNTDGVNSEKPLDNGTPTTNQDGSKKYHYTLTNVTENIAINVDVRSNTIYTVTFMTGDSVYQTQQVGYGEKATRPVDPVVEGYTFGGWYQNAECTNAWNFVDVTDAGGNVTAANTVTGNTTIYAKLDPITPTITWPAAVEQVGYELKFTTPDALVNLTGNTGKVAYNDKVTFTITISTGYDASKMQVGVNGILYAPNEKNGNVYTFEFTAKVDTKITVTGIERKTVTIIYNANARDDVSGMPEAQTVKYYLDTPTAVNDTIINQIPVRTGYKFLGWSKDSKADAADSDYTVEKIEAGTTAKFTENTTLYAVWEAQSTNVTLAITDVAYAPSAGRVIQYEGESITLQASLNVGAKGTIEFYKAATSSAAGTKIGSTTVNGMTAELSVKVGEYKTTAKDEYYYAIFKSEADEGYADSAKSNEMNVGIFSKAICWVIGDATASELLVYKGNGATGTPITDPMIAGQTYTLKVKTDKITGVETLDSKKPVLGQDYKIVWQYYEVDKNDWKTVSESSDTATYLVTGEYSGYQFRAQIVPLGKDHDSLYLKAAKYGDAGLLKDQYDVCLYTKPTSATTLQTTTTELEITGADDEAANVTINGASDVFTAAHLAQFEGQKVTLTATVTDTTTDAGVKSGEVKFYRYVDGTTDELLNTTLISVDSNGVATYEVTISNWDTNQTAANNKDEFYAVYLANATYDTSSSKAAPQAVYIKSTTIKTPIIDSKLEGEGSKKATTYNDNLTGLLAGVKHTFTLRQTGAEATTGDWSVVALDGRTVDATNYAIEWQYKTGDNFVKANNESTQAAYTTTTTKVDDRYRVKLTGKGVFAGSEATSKDAVIGTKQDVTVTVKAIDAITKTPETDVYQLNEITLTATVAAAKGADATMKPTGTVTFYYLEEGATNKWIELGTSTLTKDAQSTQGEMVATLQTAKLPVAKTTYTSLTSKITAVYSGDDTFQQNQAFTKGAASTEDLVFGEIAKVGDNTTNNVEVTVRSSVVKGCADANKAVTTLSDTGIHISADGLAAHEGLVTLKLDEVYTLDAKEAYSKLLAGTDYTVQWQILSGASAYNNGGDYSSADAWVNIDGATDTTYTLTTVAQDAAYRAVITVANEPITKGSFTKIRQDATDDLLNGHKQYYSNVLCAADGQTTIDVLIDTNGRGTNKEGITEGETVNVNVFLSGATQATPIADVTVKIENDTAKGNNETYSTTLTGSTVNGWNVFPWNTVGVAPGFYKVTVSSKSNTGYADETVTRSLIVRESSYTIAPSNTTVTYNGRTQGLTVDLEGFDFNGTGINEAANKSWTVKYYVQNVEGLETGALVEPTQAGTYKAIVTLPASAYWTEQSIETPFTIEKRSVSIADAIAQAKVYDGTTDVSIVEVMLNDAVTDQTTNGTGLPTNNVGIINGDSIYAVATEAKLSSANAGDNSFTISTIELRGDDAANYVWDGTAAYTEDIYVSRSQVYGVSSTDVTLKAGEKLPADAVYMIDQAGNKITTYDVLYYLHTDTEIKKVDNTNEKGLYTVIVRPKQDNYKSGVTLKVTVGDTTSYTAAVAPKPSTLIAISNTAELYGAATGVTASTTNSTATTTIEYQGVSTGWTATAPTNAGRYLVKVTASTGDVAYGIYTITKAHPSIDFNAATDLTYNSMPQNGYTTLTGVEGKDASKDYYITYAGDVAIGYNTPADGNVDEQSPVDAGTYTVTLHVNETANYTAHEISKSFTIAKKALTIKAKHVGAWQYGSMPGFYASYEGLAGDVNDSTPDTSLRDVQIAPELLFNPTSNNQSNYSNDALDQVGKIIIRPVDALSKNYELTPVDGEFTKNEEDPKPTLTILGLPQNGKSADVTVYYGDEIQLSAYGNYLARRNTSSFLKWEITNSTLTNGSVSIDENNILHVNGVGTFTVKLTRGTARQAITTEINVTAIQKEAKIALKNVDKVYNGASQTYDYTDNVTVHDELYQPIGNFVDSKLTRTNTARINVGTQITTAKVTGAWAYQSETYGGKFTINDKEATVAPGAQSTVYGTLEAFDTNPKYTVTNEVNSVAAVSGVNVASQTDAYNRLDVHDGYEILVAGTENMNYNVKYTTDHNDTAKNADDSAVTTYGGMKLYSTTTKAKNELNDATVYGEQANDLDWILDAVKSTTRDSVDYADNLADFDLTDTTGIFIKQDKDDCVGNAKTYKAANREEGNTSSTALAADRTATDTAKDDNYELKFGSVTNAKAANYTLANAEVKNAEGTMTAPTGTVGFIGAAATSDNLIEGSANIAQRPIKLEQAVTDAQLYWRLPQSQLYTALVNILKAEENSVGRGLAKGHTIEDLDLSFTIKVGSTTYNVAKNGTDAINFAATGNATVTATVGDTNYKLEGGQYQFDIVLKNIQIEATYTTKTFTGFTVLIKVHNENGTITPLNDAKGLSYKIFKKTAGGIDKSTAYASGTLTYQNRTAYDDKGGLCGVFTATYPQLPLLNSGETYFIQMYEYGVELKTNS